MTSSSNRAHSCVPFVGSLSGDFSTGEERRGLRIVSSSRAAQRRHFHCDGAHSTYSPPPGRRRIFPRMHSQHDCGSCSAVDIWPPSSLLAVFHKRGSQAVTTITESTANAVLILGCWSCLSSEWKNLPGIASWHSGVQFVTLTRVVHHRSHPQLILY